MRSTIIAIIWVLAVYGFAAAKSITLSASDAFPYSTPDNKGVADLIVLEVLKREGISGTILYAPSERSLINANEGVVDGEFLRIAGLESNYKNLVMVPEYICENEFAAFSKTPLNVSDWSSLNPYNVGFITGWKILETNITSARSITKVKNDQALFDLLLNDRADLVVFERLRGEAYLKANRIHGVKVNLPVLAKRKMYLYLHSRNAHMVPRLAKALRKMKQDGTVRRISDSVLGK